MWSLRKRRTVRQLTISLAIVACLTGATYLCVQVFTAPRDKSSSTPSRVVQSLPLKVFPKRRVYALPFDYIINSRHLCLGNNTAPPRVDYIFMVFSAVGNAGHRSAIRETWGRDVKSHADTRMLFLLGATNDSQLQSSVQSESSLHSDIVQESFIDAYRNVTLKSIMMLRWASTFCRHARFVVKVDDDTYLNVANLFATMAARSPDAVYGKLFKGSKPIRDPNNKWHVSVEEYSDSSYPNYVAGSAYVLGRRVVETLYRATGHVKPFPMEDAYITGACAESARVPRVDHSGFNSQKIESLCVMKNSVSSHYTSPKEMYALREQLRRTEFVCFRLLFHFAYYCYCRTPPPT